MKFSAIHPLHQFSPVAGLPDFPSLTGRNYQTVKCAHCGLVALQRRGDTFLTLTGVNVASHDMMRVRLCVAATDDRYGHLHAKITDNNLSLRGPAFSHLACGTMHRVVPPPTDETGRLRGVWVAGPSGPIKVLEGEFLPVKVRERTRAPRQLTAT